MAAIIRDIIIEQGGVLRETFMLKAGVAPYDLTGYTSKLIFLDKDGVVVHTSTTENGEVVIDALTGMLGSRVPATVTVNMPLSIVSYDWELTPQSGEADTWKIYRGKCHVLKEGSSGRG